MAAGTRLLAFRCTGCGNCCREVRVPLTHLDVSRLVARTGRVAESLCAWLAVGSVDIEGEPETLVRLDEGLRLLVLRHQAGSCVLLGGDDRCLVYSARPMPCRTYPLDASFGKRGGLKRLRLLAGADCDLARDGAVDIQRLRADTRAQQAELAEYATLVGRWNRQQRRRSRLGFRMHAASDFVSFISVSEA